MSSSSVLPNLSSLSESTPACLLAPKLRYVCWHAQESNAGLYSGQKTMKVALFEQVKIAEALKAQADAQFFEQKLPEDAKLYTKQRDVESLATMGKAKAEYVASMLGVLGSNYHVLRDYLMINDNMYQEMACINTGVVSGM